MFTTKNEKQVTTHSPNGEFVFPMHIGSHLSVLEKLMRSHSESTYKLKQCLGASSSTAHNFDISRLEYNIKTKTFGIARQEQEYNKEK